jgi:hypothetical protein
MENVSPTGKPLFPAWVPKAAAFIVAVAVAGLQALPERTIAHHVAEVIVQAGSVLGIISQGARKQE